MFVRTVGWQTIQKGLLLGAVLAAAGAMLVWPQAVATGIRRGLSVCGSVLIPGLLPFLVLANFLVRAGLCEGIGRRLEPVVRTLFCLPGRCAAAILIGLCGGYPVGGAAVAELYRNGGITRQQGRRMLRFCVNAGPAFVVSTVGAGLLGSVQAGAVLYAAQLAAALTIGVADGLLERFRRGRTPELSVVPHPTQPAAVALVGAVGDACGALLHMCGFVLLAAALLALTDAVGVTAALANVPMMQALLPGLFEVSCGCVEAAARAGAPLVLGCIIGWGGLSVHGQLAAALSGTGLMNSGYFAARLLQALLAGLFSVLLYRVVPLPATVMAPLSGGVTVEPLAGTIGSGVALLLMCGLFLLGTGQKEVAT